MKLHLPKALFTAVLAAFAVSPTYAEVTSDDLLWALSFDGVVTNNLSGGATVSNSFTINDVTGAGSLQSQAVVFNNLNLAASTGFTISFDLLSANVNAWNNILSLKSLGDAPRNQLDFQKDNEGDGKLHIYTMGDGGPKGFGGGTKVGNEPVLGTLSSWIGSTMTITYSTTSQQYDETTQTTTYTSSLCTYKDGELKNTFTFTHTEEPKELLQVAFGGDVSGGRKANIMAVSDVGIWSGAMTADEVAALVVTPVYTATLTGEVTPENVQWEQDGASVNYADIQTYSNMQFTVAGEAGATLVCTDALLARKVEIEGGDLTLQGSMVVNGLIIKDGSGLIINQGATLTYRANGVIELDQMSGTGTITAAYGAEIQQGVTSDFAGKIDVSSGVLFFGAGGDKGTIDLSDATITLNGGSELKVQGKQSQLGKLEVLDNATLRMFDGNEENDAYLTEYTISIGEVTIAANKTLTVVKNWEGHLHIEELDAEGKLNMQHSEKVVATIQSITKSGDIDNSGQTTLGVSGDDVLTLGGDVTNTGTLIIKGQLAGESTISGGTINVESTASVTGDITFGSGITLAGTITNSGNLTLTGGLTASSLEVFDAAGDSAISYANGDVEGNGYLSSALTIVQSASDSSQLTANGLTLTVGGVAYDLSQNGNDLQLIIDGDGGNYYVNNTQEYAAGRKIADAATTGIVMNGGTLNLNTALADRISISTAKAGSVINVADGVTLSNSSVAAGSTKSTITGGKNAVFDLGTGLEGAMSSVIFNVNYGEQWEGITQITNSHLGESRLDNLCGGGKGTLKLVGLSGWLVRGQTVQADILLENYSNTVDGVTTTKSAFVFDDNSQDNYTFAGDISGSGDFRVASKSGSKAELNFTGSTENWTGGIVVTNAYKYSTDAEKNATNEVTINLTHGGDIFSAEGNKGFVMDRASTNTGNNIINLNIGNADADSTMNGAISMGDNADESSQLKLTVKGDTTFKKEVEVTSLTVDANKTATLEAETTTGSLTTNGTVKLTGAGSLTYGGTTTVAAPSPPRSNAEAAAATITSDAITGGVVSFVSDAAVTESRVISDSSIINNGTGTVSVTVGGQNASVSAVKGNIEMAAGTGTTVADVSVGSGLQISTTGDLTVTDSLSISSMNALSVTGALVLTGATVDLSGFTVNTTTAQQEYVYTLGTAKGGIIRDEKISFTGLTVEGYNIDITTMPVTSESGIAMAAEGDTTALVLKLTANQPAEQPLDKLTITGGTFDATSGVLTFATDKAVTDNLASTIEVTMSDEVWNGILEKYTTLPDTVLVSFQGKDSEQFFDFNGADDTGTVPTITINGEGVTGDLVVRGEGTIVGNYVTAYIPEPTTTTLSLLALAGLAVRRRRASR